MRLVLDVDRTHPEPRGGVGADRSGVAAKPGIDGWKLGAAAPAAVTPARSTWGLRRIRDVPRTGVAASWVVAPGVLTCVM